MCLLECGHLRIFSDGRHMYLYNGHKTYTHLHYGERHVYRDMDIYVSRSTHKHGHKLKMCPHMDMRVSMMCYILIFKDERHMYLLIHT